MCGQEQGLRRISDGARGGLGVGPVRREPRTCRSRERGQHGQLVAPTVAAPTQAAKLSRLEDIGPPPVPYMKKQPSWAGGKASFLWEAIEERLFAQKGFNPSKLSRRPPKPTETEV